MTLHLWSVQCRDIIGNRVILVLTTLPENVSQTSIPPAGVSSAVRTGARYDGRMVSMSGRSACSLTCVDELRPTQNSCESTACPRVPQKSTWVGTLLAEP